MSSAEVKGAIIYAYDESLGFSLEGRRNFNVISAYSKSRS